MKTTPLVANIYKRIPLETKYGSTYVVLNAMSLKFKKYRL